MSRQLVPSQGAVAPRNGGLVSVGVAAQSTARISFSGEIVTWDQLPASVRHAASRPSSVVAEAVQLDARAWVENGRSFGRAFAWRVYDDGVVIAKVVRPMAPAPTGGVHPVGPWEDRGVRVREASGPVRRRRGVVDVADELDARGGAHGIGPAAAAPADHAQAAEAWAYLPQAVRAAAERLVPEPDVWLGQIVQERSADGFPTRQDVRSIRMSENRAVVLLASRELAPIPGAGVAHHVSQMARVPWLVEQVGFDLGSPEARARLSRA